LSVLALGAALLTGCGGAGAGGSSNGGEPPVKAGPWGGLINAGGTPVHGGTLSVDQLAAPQGVSPLYYVNNSNNQIGQVVQQMFDQLVEYLPGSIEPQPGLATRWKVSPDARTYTFSLRAARFSNGMPVTAADVKYSLDYAKNPRSTYANLYDVIASIDTPTPRTVVVHLTQPSRAFLYYAAYIAASIVPAGLVKHEGINAFNRHPVGSGPFLLMAWRPGQEIDLARNPTYWRKGLPYLDDVRLLAAPSGNTRTLDVQSGTVDVSDSVPFSEIAGINSSGNAKVMVSPGTDMFVVWINNLQTPLKETPVRVALNYATPVQSIIKVAFAGLAPRMNTIIPKLKYWTAAAKPYPYDIAAAKASLTHSSVPHGFHAVLEYDSSSQQADQVAQIVQSAWAQIGVKLTLKPVDTASTETDFSTGKYQLMLFIPGAFTSNVPVDDEMATLMFNSPATHNLFTWYKDPAVTRLAQQAGTALSDQQRAKLFGEMHVASMKDPAVVPLVYTPNVVAVANDVRDFNEVLSQAWRLETVWLRR
jgi:peptide/nickel transport system substrate-binding protein